MSDHSARMRQVLDKLSKDERLVCIWKLAGFSTRDIARHMKRSESAIEELYARAKRKVRHLLAEQGPGE
jgi:DNA-directed RNA polymerase specialized sigma24 family protein